jgi:hypothetical protein
MSLERIKEINLYNISKSEINEIVNVLDNSRLYEKIDILFYIIDNVEIQKEPWNSILKKDRNLLLKAKQLNEFNSFSAISFKEDLEIHEKMKKEVNNIDNEFFKDYAIMVKDWEINLALKATCIAIMIEGETNIERLKNEVTELQEKFDEEIELYGRSGFPEEVAEMEICSDFKREYLNKYQSGFREGTIDDLL